MAAHARLKNEFTEDEKCLNLMSWLISPFEKQIMKKIDKLQGTLKKISENVSKLTNLISESKENTTSKEVVSDIRDASNEILKEMAGTLNEILKAKDTTLSSQPVEIQESTQILNEQEAEKAKQSMFKIWNTKLQKRAAEFWQLIRNENTSKIY